MDTSQGSRTARAVAVGRAVGVGGRRDEHVAALLPGPDRAAVALARGVGAGRRSTVLAWSGHPALRMLAVDSALTEAVRVTRAARVVVLGAGYDTRAWRLQALDRLRVLEIDHPATQAEKVRGLPPLAEARARLTMVGADLTTDDLVAVLDRAGHDPADRTVWLWEAVVPYLPAEAVDRTLTAIRARSAPGDRLLVTTVTDALFDPPSLGRALAGPARLAMQALGEPVLLAESDAQAAARLSRHGWLARQVTGPRRWAADAGMTVVGPTLDERLHVADRVG